MTINTYDDEKTYKHGEFCEHNGVTYRASCGGSSVVGIAPDDNSIGVFWIVDEDTTDSGVVRGLNPQHIDWDYTLYSCYTSVRLTLYWFSQENI